MHCQDSLFLEHVGHRLITVSVGSRAQGGGDGQQGIHLLVLLQDLVILGAALMVCLHPVATNSNFTPYE